jgi:hypothetical protein
VFVNSREERGQSGGKAGEADECLGEFVIVGGDAADVFDPKMAASLPGLSELDLASITGLHKGRSKLAEIIFNYLLDTFGRN